jgi:hypothetical protein
LTIGRVIVFKFRSYIVILVLGIIILISGACANSPLQTMTATPLEVPQEGSPGEYITVRIQLSSEQPCMLILSTIHKTEIDNYLAPYTTGTIVYPDNNKVVTWHEQIPWETTPGSYILRVIQMRDAGDTEGTEIFSQDFRVKY